MLIRDERLEAFMDARYCLAALALLLGLDSNATAAHDLASPAGEGTVTGPHWAGPAVSGAWYAAARDGEGIIVQYLPDGRALAVWFTYPAVGEPGEQAWLIAQDGVVDGDTIRFATVYQPQGGVFGDAFDPAAIQLVPWGTLDLQLDGCGAMTARYAGPAAYGSGERSLSRLTVIDQLDCNGARRLTATGARALAGLRARSGAWYVSTRSGEGWLIEELADGRSVVYWFTYTPQGRQAWTIGIGTRDGDRLVIDDNLITRGTRFGSAFDPAAVERIGWGRIELTFVDCNTVDVAYDSTQVGYGAAQRRAVRLTALVSAVCVDGTPQPRSNGSWVEAASLPPLPQSEHAATVWDNRIYVLGGFGDPRGFKRYDPQSGQWAELPDLPAGRDHLAAFAFEGAIYMSGGAPNDGGDQSVGGFRYDIAAGRWDPRPELLFNLGSHAAVLNGRAYIGTDDGSLQEYDPRRRASRRIEPANAAIGRDHSQVVAFLGEIWMIAGRLPENAAVAIYDPVSERWRVGPALQRRRGGFAAAVVDDQIVVGGGELIATFPGSVVPSVEVYTTGADAWQFAPNLPIPVHGVAGAGLLGRFHAISGATVAGSISGTTGRMFYIQLVP
jgi:hypothetical protein